MSEKIKEIKRLLELMKTADWSEFKGYIGKIEQMLNNVEKPKRKPLSDGTLELTDEELSEFIYLFYPNTKTLKISASGCFILSNAERNIINNYKAILYLAERFELTEK